MVRYRYMDKQELIAINHEAIRSNRNRTLHPKKLTELGEETLFPIGMEILHNDSEVRCHIILSEQGANAWLDMPIERYQQLRVFDEGEQEEEDEE